MRKLIPILAVLLVGIQGVFGQCNMPSSGQWNTTNLVAGNSGNLDWPVSMDVLPDGRVIIIEMWTGDVKLYTGQGVQTVGNIEVYTDNSSGTGVENGGLGLVAHHDFDTNPWVYIFYSRRIPGNNYSAGDGGISPHEHVLTRYTLTNNQLTNPKDIITVERLSARHAAGGVDIDPVTGDIYITTGDDSYPHPIEAQYGPRQESTEHLNSLRSSANTNDLRGKTVRIRPILFPDSETPEMGIGTTYEIPEGNMREVFEDFWTQAGENLDDVRPEIFTMGHRNPYHVKFDPITGLSITGEVGPDGRSDGSRGPRGREEFNILRAGFYGWPYAIGDAPYTSAGGEAVSSGITFDLDNIKNNSSQNTGVEQLPPAIPAFGFYGSGSAPGVNSGFGTGGQCAIAGPLYHYDENLDSDVKLPAFFNGKWITGDWSMGRLWSLEMNSVNGEFELEAVQTISQSGYFRIIDIELGPDGSLYILRYATAGNSYHGNSNSGALIRLEYTGPQYAANACSHFVPEERIVPVAFRPETRLSPSGHALVHLNPNGLYKVQEGATGVRIYDLDGKLIRTLSFEKGQTHFDVPARNGMVLFSFY